MTTTTTREQVLEFAAAYPTPNVWAAVAYAEAGRITWEQVATLFGQALTAGIATVSA